MRKGSFYSRFLLLLAFACLQIHAIKFADWKAKVRAEALPNPTTGTTKAMAEIAYSKTIPYGTVMEFSNEKQFVLGNFLGGNSQSAVYEVVGGGDVEVIRIPSHFSMDHSAEDFLNAMIVGTGILKKYKVQCVDMRDHLENEYMGVSRLEASSLVAEGPLQAIKNSDGSSAGGLEATPIARLDLDSKRNALRALIPMAESTAAFETIGDFKPTQLHYSPTTNKWELADWAHLPNSVGTAVNYHSLFDPDRATSRSDDRVFGTYAGILGLEKKDGRYVDTEYTESSFRDVPLEERLALLSEIDQAIIKKRLELAKSDDFRADATHYRLRPEEYRTTRITLKPRPISPRPPPFTLGVGGNQLMGRSCGAGLRKAPPPPPPLWTM